MKKIIAILLTCTLVFTCLSAFAHPFTDITGHWAENEIAKAYESNIVSGDGDGSFRPNDTISRAEFMKMTTALLAEKFGADIAEVEGASHWADKYYSLAIKTYLPPIPELSYDGVSAGVMSAQNYDLPIHRWEMAYILDNAFANLFGIRTAGADALNDMEQIRENYNPLIVASIANMAGLGISQGDENGNFNAAATGTRAEAVTLINRSAGVMDYAFALYEQYDAQQKAIEENLVTYEDIPEGHPIVVFTMADGQSFEITLYPEFAPQTCANFVSLVKSGFYDGLTFHRVVDGFMAQGGDPDGNGSGGSGKNIVGEFASNGFTKNTISHTKGVVSMARTDHPNSASSQFFICYGNANSLDGNYAAFGKVTWGMETVEAFLEVERTVGNDGALSSPTKPIVIAKAAMK